jgi:hypothetical protein
MAASGQTSAAKGRCGPRRGHRRHRAPCQRLLPLPRLSLRTARRTTALRRGSDVGRLGGMPTKRDQRVLAIRLLRRTGIGDFGDATNGGLSRQPEFFSRLAIDTFLPGVLTQRTSFETALRMLRPALHSSVSPSDFACSAVRGSWTFATSLMPFEDRIVLVMFHSTRKERRLPRLKSEASAPCFL